MTDASHWNEPPAIPVLCAGAVHGWRAPLDVPPHVAEALSHVLGRDERARAQRFRRKADRRRFTVARGLLRTIVASYLGAAPRALQFAYGQYGKPVLVRPVGANASWLDLAFNVSHSGEVVLVALAHGRRVGIDVEQMRSHVATASLARRFFSDDEVAILQSLEGESRIAAFYRIWTRKEAYLKARGVGLSGLLASREDPAERSRWTLTDLPIGHDYAAALAVEGRDGVVCLWQWRWPGFEPTSPAQS